MRNHIISIGISKHQIATANLDYAAIDATEFFDLFVGNISDLGFKKLLVDSEATLSQIRTSLGAELQQAVQPGDAFFFYYSGHGVTAEDPLDESSDSHYLVPFDATFDYANSCIPISYLLQSLQKLPSKANLIFIDSCFSGAAAKHSKGLTTAKRKNIKTTKTISNTISGVGRITITASKDSEEAIEDLELKNGLFTHYLLEELQKDKGKETFAVLDLFTPICEQVTKRAKEKHNHVQTPTLNGQLEGNILLPTFRIRTRITPQLLQVPRSAELSSASFPIPVIELEDKEQQRLLNEMVELVARGRDPQRQFSESIIFERFCSQLIKRLKADWEKILGESDGSVSEIPKAVAKLEAASFQFLLLGGVVAAFGSDEQMRMYSDYAIEILLLKQGRAGLVALISTPEIVLEELVYVIGALSIARGNLKPWDILLKTMIYDLRNSENPPLPLILHTEIHYCDALGSYSTKVNDHVRSFLSNLSWLQALAPKLEGDVTDFQLQANLLLVLLTVHNGEYLWPDFARYYAHRVSPLVNRVKFVPEFRQQIAKMFELDPAKIGQKFMEYLQIVASRGMDNYSWSSIEVNAFLTEEEKKKIDQVII